MNIDIGVDFGTNNVVIYSEGKGIVLSEPSLVAYNMKKKKAVAIGNEAAQMLGKAPPYIKIIRPLENGSISDFKMAEVLLKGLLTKIFGNLFFKPTVAMCVPSGITGIERSAFISTALAAGARQVILIEAPLASAIGCGIDFKVSRGNMIVDIGAGSTDIAVVSFGGVVDSHSERTGGYDMDEAIINYVLKEKKVLIGQRTAEAAKIKIGTLLEDAATEETEVKGVSTITDLPASVKITNREISEAIAPTAERITKAIHTLFEKTPPELTGDILENGIILTGGTALTRGIDKFISVRLGVKVRVMDDAINRVAIGTGTCFKVTDDLIDASFEEAGI